MELDEQQMRDRVAAARCARLATVDPEGRPHLVPLVFALDGWRLWTAVDRKPKRHRDLRRLRNIAAQPRVSVLVDHYEEDWSRLWWVRLDGDAHVAPRDRWDHAVDLLRRKYPQYGREPPDGPVIAIDVSTWRGWAAGADA